MPLKGIGLKTRKRIVSLLAEVSEENLLKSDSNVLKSSFEVVLFTLSFLARDLLELLMLPPLSSDELLDLDFFLPNMTTCYYLLKDMILKCKPAFIKAILINIYEVTFIIITTLKFIKPKPKFEKESYLVLTFTLHFKNLA